MAKFKFAPIARFWNTVLITRPDGVAQEFDAEFVYLDDVQWAKLGTQATGEFLKGHLTNWRGIVGDDDQDYAFTPERLAELLQHPYISVPMLTAYTDGRRGFRAKN